MTRVIHLNLDDLRSSDLAEAVKLLKENQVVAFPTETVYGLGANALEPEAVKHIFQAKGRPSDNPLIVHISSLEMLSSLLPSTNKASKALEIYKPILDQLWPGPLTILIPRSPKIPLSVTGGHETVAIRMPSHPVALKLIENCGFPLAAPSANTSGRPSPTQASHVFGDLQNRIPLILDGGDCDCGIESTVLDGLRSPPVVLRPGSITYESLSKFPTLQGLQVYKKNQKGLENMEEAPTTPGMKYRHYTPDAQVYLYELNSTKQVQRQLIAEKIREMSQDGLVLGVMRSGEPICENDLSGHEFVLGKTPQEVAHNLFKGLRYLEEQGCQVILVEGIKDTEEGLGVMNRLRKAASTTISC
jgi:L-threonylcarbamoyladenylate synthase